MTKQKSNLDSTIKEAVAFHGHIGPFLIVGIRMGLIGLKELKMSRSDFALQMTAILKLTPPFSCVIDGLQITTHCTVGNGKLKLRNKPESISAVFETKDKRKVSVTLKPAKYKELKEKMGEDRQSYRNVQLARRIASTAEEDLFTIKKG